MKGLHGLPIVFGVSIAVILLLSSAEASGGTKSCGATVGGPLNPGTCPASNPNVECVHCYDNCVTDAECGTTQKCCLQNGCGNSCTDALPVGWTGH